MANFSTAFWQKATRSGANSNCVEIAFFDDIVGVRDSKNPAKEPHKFTHAEWNNFLEAAKNERDIP